MFTWTTHAFSPPLPKETGPDENQKRPPAAHRDAEGSLRRTGRLLIFKFLLEYFELEFSIHPGGSQEVFLSLESTRQSDGQTAIR